MFRCSEYLHKSCFRWRLLETVRLHATMLFHTSAVDVQKTLTLAFFNKLAG